MKPIAFLYYVAVLLATACAASDLEPVEFDPGEGPDQLAMLELPVWMSNGYGIDSRQRRCIASRGWGPDSTCQIPLRKRATIGTALDSGCSQSQVADIYFALAMVQIQAVSAGWTITTPQPGAIGLWQDAQVFYDDSWPIRCTSIDTGALARTRPWMIPGLNYSCHDVTLVGVPVCAGCRYEVCKYQQGWIDIDFAAIKSLPGYGPLTNAQRSNVRVNHIMHELYHVMGLGHEPDSTSPTLLMAKGSQTLNGSFVGTAWVNGMNPTAHESWMLRTFNPNGDTPNP
jgi:hypothetical protein